MAASHDDYYDEGGCVLDTYDLDEQRAMLERFELSRTATDVHDGPASSDPLYPRNASDPQPQDDLNASCLLEDLDEDVVREQERILAEIQRSQSSLSKLTVKETKLSSSTSASSTATASTAASSSSSRSLEDDLRSSDEGLVRFDRPPPAPRSLPGSPLGTPPRSTRTMMAPPPPLAKSRRRLSILRNMSKQESESGFLRYYDRTTAERPEALRRVESDATATSQPSSPLPSKTRLRATKSAPEGKVTVRCAGECGRKYFVSAKCKVLLCPRCETLTPTSLGLVE